MAEQTPVETAELMEVAEATNAGVKLNVPAMLTNMSMQNVVAYQQAMLQEQLGNQQAMNITRQVAVQEFVRRNSERDLEEATAAQKLATTGDSASGISATLTAALAQILAQKVPAGT